MKTINEYNRIDEFEPELRKAAAAITGGTMKQQNYAIDILLKAVVHFWNESLTRGQRTQENYDIILKAVSAKTDPVWWIEHGKGNFARNFQDVMPRLSLPKSGDPDWYKR